MSDEFIEINLKMRKSTYNKLEQIVGYLNMRHKLWNDENQYSPATIEELILGATVQEIEKIETLNYDIIYEGDQNLGEKKLVLKNRIKDILKERKMKQLDLCELTGIDRSNLSMIVNNRNQPSADYLLRIWFALGCIPLEDLFYREEK
ncbi:helix-turn-helix transcriptional regulator [Bacillus sp. SCS-151]|uniref:helix-turn-helix transcriptional regulator n=1 Tax=Nanhaiella sioensis TaxID=3115293 RepID=UPI00397D4DE5